jgi:hypothetical protein
MFTKFFKIDCQQMLCFDFCQNKYLLNTNNCLKECNDNLVEKKEIKTNENIEFILKKFFLYRNKNEILNDSNNKGKDKNINNENNYNKFDDEISSLDKSKTIESSKKKIDILRKKLLEEESNLLDLYKLKS